MTTSPYFNSTSATASPAVFMDWRLAAARLPYEPRPELPEVYRRLSQVERATIRVVAPPLSEFPLRNSLVGEAAARLCTLGDRGSLVSMSGQQIARTLHCVLRSINPIALRYARFGWAVLAALDAADLGVEVWVGAEPDADDPRRFRTMRLSERCAELDIPLKVSAVR